ncbi:MAG: hypothetical protein ACT6FC_06365 [Methanosarcinaceae archaeon]
MFKDTPCLLCGKIHEVKIHQFVDRNISPDNSRKIKTVRIICHSNFQEREETGEKLQYTITVLPGFLVPHSRVPLPDIYKATDEYLSGRKIIQQEAALIMNCQSRHSFRLYYDRICNLASKWIFYLFTVFPEIIEKEIPVDMRKKWKQFKGILEEQTIIRMGFSGQIEMLYRFEYTHDTLLHKNMGLGP